MTHQNCKFCPTFVPALASMRFHHRGGMHSCERTSSAGLYDTSLHSAVWTCKGKREVYTHPPNPVTWSDGESGMKQIANEFSSSVVSPTVRA
uniref:C2H2-type domain-containing protein n=1 Tax=Anopheles minimus TaxID=112268 RepID=A0A182WMY9_9DIPT